MKENKKELLEVGDKIAVFFGGKMDCITAIDRVTKTLAFCGGTRLRRSYSGGSLVVVPRRSFSATRYELATAEHVERYEKRKKVDFIRNFPFSILPTEKLNQVYNILKQD